MEPISRERAERIARGQACEKCGEYSYKRLVVRAATPDQREMDVVWHVAKTCGVCGLQQETGLDAEGDTVYSG